MYARALQADDLDSLLQIAKVEISLLEVKAKETKEKGDSSAASYQRELNEWKGKEELYIMAIADKDIEIKRERRKRRLATGLGLLTTGAAIYLSTLK